MRIVLLRILYTLGLNLYKWSEQRLLLLEGNGTSVEREVSNTPSNSSVFSELKIKFENIKNKLDGVTNGILKRKLKQILTLLTEILQYAQDLDSQHEQQKVITKTVFVYHIDSLNAIIDKYIRLTKNATTIDQAISFADKVNPSFDESIVFLKEYLTKIQEDDLMGLNVELECFKNLV
jgi:hypothetical protein